MKPKRLPADSTLYAEAIFREKDKYHRRRATMSFARKLEVLDRLINMRRHLPKLSR
jgi:hypothetical protein